MVESGSVLCSDQNYAQRDAQSKSDEETDRETEARLVSVHATSVSLLVRSIEQVFALQ